MPSGRSQVWISPWEKFRKKFWLKSQKKRSQLSSACMMEVRMTGVLPNSWKGRGVCYLVYMISAHKRTCVDCRNMPNHHTSTYSYHVWVCVNGSNEGDCTKRICVLLEACNPYASQGVDLGEGGSLSYWHDIVKSDWPWLQMWSGLESLWLSSLVAI